MPTTERQERRLLGGAVRAIREAQKVRQDILALAADINPSYLSKLENGHQQPSLDVIYRLAANLKVKLTDISYIATIFETEQDVA